MSTPAAIYFIKYQYIKPICLTEQRSKAPTSQLMNMKQPPDPPLSCRFCSSPPPQTSASNSPPTHPSLNCCSHHPPIPQLLFHPPTHPWIAVPTPTHPSIAVPPTHPSLNCCSHHPPIPQLLFPPPTHPSIAVPTSKAGDHHLLHLKRAKYMRKPYVLVRGIIKNSVQRRDGVSENLPICYRLW